MGFFTEQERMYQSLAGIGTCDICGCRLFEGELIVQTSRQKLISGAMPEPQYKEVITVRCESCWENEIYIGEGEDKI